MRRLSLMLLVMLCTLITIFACSDKKENEETAKVPVEIMVAELGRVVQTLHYNGDIKAEYEVKVFSKIPDRIEKYFIDEGEYIARGAPIAQIHAATIEQGVKQAEAGYAAAKAQEVNMQVEFERSKKLFQENAMSKQQYDMVQTQYEAVKAALEQAQAALISAKSSLADATVSAPISGIIGKRYNEAGDMANPAVPLVSIVQMDRVKITFEATESDLGKLEIGQQAVVKVKSYPEQEFVGSVVKISPILDPLTRMASIEVLSDNPDGKLKPGMFARVQVRTGVIENTIVVPRYATFENTTMQKVDGQDQVVTDYYVYVVEQDTAVQRKLDVKYINHVQLAVEGGLNAGEWLVTTGQANLRDGSPVSVSKREGVAL
ncbi:efflux RND transporter periplasmic adaptor subunit [candidate division KSB1 bacterium]|nr:efflux RND transporter periplasmic adaptor subunit [candidate division KSB1 bacterium]